MRARSDSSLPASTAPAASNAASTLLAAIAFGPTDSLVVAGTGRGGKDREEVLKPALLAERLGKRGRKGKELDIKFNATLLKKLV